MKRIYLFLACLFLAFVVNAGVMSVLGPYSMSLDSPTPEGYTKVVVKPNPDYTGGSIELSSAEMGKFIIHGSVTYVNMWYYFIPSGTYLVEGIASRYKATVNGFPVTVGSTVAFSGSNGAVYFFVIDSDN